MRVRAHAKINLSLRVLGVRADGYHELRTVFQSIALHDTLTIRRARGPFRLTCDDPACPADDTNLVWRAAARLWKASGRRGALRDISIDVTKRIPMQAGLGGGSSDAAAVLSALGRAWRVDEAIVRETGAAIGADVPYFFEGGTVLGLERGDLLFPLVDEPRAFVVLVLPNFGVSTGDAFTWLDQAAARSSNPQIRGSSTLNDLQPPVVAHHPEIGRIISALRRVGADQAAMSGSGSAVFGLFSARTAAIEAGRRLTSRRRRVLVTRTLTRREFRALARI
ncbi:MAG TPA: 4-(cytidine 5'-diphospho)-2-C-methyl-D-erythritol kinase [Vicinamibacterales bacterium]